MSFARRGGIVLLLFGVLVMGCGTAAPTVASATLGTTVTASKIEDPKTAFTPGDHMIHLVVTVDNAAPNTTVGAKWYAVGESNRLLFEGDAAIDPFNTTADFALTNANDWRAGSYQVVVYLNGQKERTIDFVVK